MKSAVTVSLVPQAKGGPFVFWNGLAGAFENASRLGFDAVEIFPPNAASLNLDEIRSLSNQYHLPVAAVGTGGGWVIHKQQLCHPDSENRQAAQQFIRDIIEVAGELQAPAIIGSMQGRWSDGVPRDQALEWLGGALNELGEHAARHQQPLLYEPLNRYETNLFNRIGDTVEFLSGLKTRNIRILADLFHMNIEESNLADAIAGGKDWIGHVHFVDSNRQAAGLGHTNFHPVFAALKSIGYQGYLSAEAFPLPDSESAARQTIDSFNHHMKGDA